MASHEEFQHDSGANASVDYAHHPDLNDLEENYRSLVENAPEIFFIVDLKGKFILLNQAIQRITGHPISSILKSDLQSLVAPEYQDSVYKILNEAPQGIVNPYFEMEIVSSNGNRVPLEVHIKTVRDRKKRIAALRGMARDITERKKIEAALKASEKQFSELTERANDGVVIVQEGICKSANKAASHILGYPLEEFTGNARQGMKFLLRSKPRFFTKKGMSRISNSSLRTSSSMDVQLKWGSSRIYPISKASKMH
jgi:PAS domain S-box-containing protein